MKLMATKPIEVFIDKGRYGNNSDETTDIVKIPIDRRLKTSSKGCYYLIEEYETFKFDRSNNWDMCFFKLENGAEFKIECGDINRILEIYSISKL